jgi:hypothetical protein
LFSMVLLFKFVSIPMMEKRNIQNKTGYVTYIKSVPDILPFFSLKSRINKK